MGLLKNLKDDTVARLNLRHAVTAGPQDTVVDAVRWMREAKLGCVIVIDADRKPVGIYTEAMLRKQLHQSPATLHDRLQMHMMDRFPWVKTTDSVQLVLDALEANNTRFLAVVDDEGRLAGLTGQKGLMEYVAEHFPSQVMVQPVGAKTCPQTREGA